MRTRRSLVLALVSAFTVVGGLVACVSDDPGGRPIEDGTDGGSDTGAPLTDAGNGPDATADTGPQRFCATESAPIGSADFFCADFDGTDVAEGFTSTYKPDGGVLSQDTEQFFSPPASFTNDGNAQLAWEKPGPTTIAQVDLRFRLHPTPLGGTTPPATGSVAIARLSVAPASVTLRYTHGENVDGQNNYTGYYLDVKVCPNACATFPKVIPTAPAPNVWTDVRLVWTKAGLVEIHYNGSKVTEVSSLSADATKASVSLGLVKLADSPKIGQHAFDNVTVSVKRD